jgi:aquaporin TIP
MKGISAPLAEFIGTFFLCFAGISAIVCTAPPIASGAGLVGIALAHGLALSVAVNAFAGVSGAHFNPAVTAAMLSTGRISPSWAVTYVVAQLAGATAAALMCCLLLPHDAIVATNLGIPLPAAWASTSTILVYEFVMTFLLVTAIFGTCVDPRAPGMKIGGFGVGLTVAFDILAGGAVTGASMNPARSFGPAFVEGHWAFHALYWIAPLAGGVAAGLIYHHLILEKGQK